MQIRREYNVLLTQTLTVLMLKFVIVCRHAAQLRFLITNRTTDTHKSIRGSSCEETAGIFLPERTSASGVQCSSLVWWTAVVSLQWHGWGVLLICLAGCHFCGTWLADGFQAHSKTLTTTYQNTGCHNQMCHNLNLAPMKTSNFSDIIWVLSLCSVQETKDWL